MRNPVRLFALVATIFCTAISLPASAWEHWGGDRGGSRFSPLNQITPDNVAGLKQAWSFSTGDMPRQGENSKGHEFSFEATPIKVGNSLYLCTPHREVIALDATTGALRWRFTPGGDMSHNVYQACRGVSYFDAPPGTACPHRIVSTASDLPRLFALDAETGKREVRSTTVRDAELKITKLFVAVPFTADRLPFLRTGRFEGQPETDPPIPLVSLNTRLENRIFDFRVRLLSRLR